MKLARARLVKMKSDNGMWEIWEHIPIGTEYTVDLDTVQETDWYNFDHHQNHKARTVMTLDEETGEWRPYPMELLELIP